MASPPHPSCGADLSHAQEWLQRAVWISDGFLLFLFWLCGRLYASIHPSIHPCIHPNLRELSTYCILKQLRFFWMQHQLDGVSINPCSPMNVDISYNIALPGSWNQWCLVDRKGTAFGRDSWQNPGAVSSKIVGQRNRSQVDTFRNWPCTDCRTCPLDIK